MPHQSDSIHYQMEMMALSWPPLPPTQVWRSDASTLVQAENRQYQVPHPPSNARILSAAHETHPTYAVQYPGPVWVNTMDQQQFPRLPPPVAIPRQYTNSPRRTLSSTTIMSSGSSSTVKAAPTPIPTPVPVPNPIPNPHATQLPPSRTLHVPILLSELTTPSALQKAIEVNPDSILNQITTLLAENVTLKAELHSMSDDFRNARMDYAQKREQYDCLISIEKAKQIVLWKHIGRLQGGLFNPDAEKMGSNPVASENWKVAGGLGGYGLKGAGERYAVREKEKEKQRQRERDFKMHAEGRFGVKHEGSRSPTRRKSPARRGSPMRAVGSPMTVVSEESDESEKSDDMASAASASTILDPTANAFIPGFGSPSKFKYHEERSNAFMQNPAFIPGMTNVPLGPDSLTNNELESLVASLPHQFYGVCPISLSTKNPCDVLSCRWPKTCNQFNDEANGGGECRQPKEGCPFVHELRTCADEIQGLTCDYNQIKEASLKKKGHMTKRVHKNGCNKDEWKSRETVAKLVLAHREGRY